MAPRKRTADDKDTVKPTADTSSVRATRSSTRRVNGNSVDDSVAPAPVKSPKKKKAKPSPEVEVKSDEVKEDVEAEAEADAETGAESKTVVIEHCKQCNSFKTRANQVKNGLENGVSGITVLLNPDKPRRGCFEIREIGGEKFISLLDMKRPFAPMKALDMDQVIADIINKIK